MCAGLACPRDDLYSDSRLRLSGMKKLSPTGMFVSTVYLPMNACSSLVYPRRQTRCGHTTFPCGCLQPERRIRVECLRIQQTLDDRAHLAAAFNISIQKSRPSQDGKERADNNCDVGVSSRVDSWGLGYPGKAWNRTTAAS